MQDGEGNSGDQKEQPRRVLHILGVAVNLHHRCIGACLRVRVTLERYPTIESCRMESLTLQPASPACGYEAGRPRGLSPDESPSIWSAPACSAPCTHLRWRIRASSVRSDMFIATS